MDRKSVLIQACDQCIKELYKYVIPRVTWEQFIEENKEYKELQEGPQPFEFYYLPKEIMESICDSYIEAYKIDNHKELKDTVEILKHYCEEPIVKATVKERNKSPYKDFKHPSNLEATITKLLKKYNTNVTLKDGQKFQRKFFKFLDMAEDFYAWNGELNSFNMTVYLGPSPSNNKDLVIKYWKKYRNKDITIPSDQVIIDNYYDE